MKLLGLAAVITAVAVAGCAGFDVPDSTDSSTNTPERPSPTQPAPAPTADASTQVCGGGSLEGCFSYNEMDDYLNAVTGMVEDFFQTTYPRVSEPRDIVFIAHGRGARSSCGVSDSYAYEYCAGDQSIYIGQDLLWQFYKGAGDAAPAIGLAHEWGHHLQTMLGVGQEVSTRKAAIAFENQADCISGAWAKYADGKGWLETEDDVRDADTLLEAIGSAEGPGRDHGTTAEREAAFNLAYQKGIAACNQYFPDAPLT
jgi:predicted metalloprotease